MNFMAYDLLLFSRYFLIQLEFYAFFDFLGSHRLAIRYINMNLAKLDLPYHFEKLFFFFRPFLLPAIHPIPSLRHIVPSPGMAHKPGGGIFF